MISEKILEKLILVVHKYTRALNIEFFLVGASARDILFQNNGIKLYLRKTYDTDFAVAVKDWEHYSTLRESLLYHPDTDFSADTRKY